VDNDSLSNHGFSSPPYMMEMGRKCLGVKSAYLHHHLFMCAKINFTRLDHGNILRRFLKLCTIWAMGIAGKWQEFFMVSTYMALVNDSDIHSFNSSMCDCIFPEYHLSCIRVSCLP
jgi:hypothetical protein